MIKFKIYKPTVPDPTRQGINNALLPWVYDQDRSSGFDATMWVTPVDTLTDPRPVWAALMRGVRVEGDTVVISTKDNDVARVLCGVLIEEMNK